MHMGHYGHPGPADDHSPERCLGDVWSILEPYRDTLKGSMIFKDGFGIFGIIGVLTRERWKSFVKVRRLFGGFRKEFWQ
jgi:hypothetical protein